MSGIAVSESTSRGWRIQRTTLAGLFGRTPATYARSAKPVSGGPTSASAPGTPGTVWQVAQP